MKIMREAFIKFNLFLNPSKHIVTCWYFFCVEGLVLDWNLAVGGLPFVGCHRLHFRHIRSSDCRMTRVRLSEGATGQFKLETLISHNNFPKQ